MSMAVDPGTTPRSLAKEYEELVGQAMAVPEVARAMEAYALVRRYQFVPPSTSQKITYASGGNPAAGWSIPFGIGGNS